MKKKLFLLTLSIFLVCGCGKIPKLKNGEEAVITFKNGDKISADELYNTLKKDYALDAAINLMDKKILEKEFKKDIKSAKKYADNQIKSMKETYGGEDKLLEAIQYYTSYSSIDAYKDFIYLSYLQNKATEAYAKSIVTDEEINKYYKDTYFGDISINHILITSNASSKSSTEDLKKAEETAKKKAEEVITKLNDAKKAGKDIKAEFKELAKTYSSDDKTKNKGGELGYINLNKLSSSYDELVNAATKLKNGEYSTKVITTELGYHVILRVDQKDKESLKNVKDEIIDILSKNKLNDTNIGAKAMQHYRNEYGVKIIDSDINKKYSTYMNNAVNSTSESQTK